MENQAVAPGARLRGDAPAGPPGEVDPLDVLSRLDAASRIELSTLTAGLLRRLAALGPVPAGSWAEGLAALPELRQVCCADGAVVLHRGRLASGGSLPDEAVLLPLTQWLLARAWSPLFVVTDLSALDPSALGLGSWARGIGGVVALRLSRAPAAPGLVLWLRRPGEGPWTVAQLAAALSIRSALLEWQLSQPEPRTGSRPYELAIEHARDAMALAVAEPGSEPRVLCVNAALSTMLGQRDSELRGQPLASLYRTRGSSAALARIERALATGQPLATELVQHRKDGTELWFELSLTPLPDPASERLHWLITQRDITDRRRESEERRQQDERMQALLSTVPVILFAVSGRGARGPSWVSDNCRSITGFPPESLVDSAVWLERAHEEDRPRLRTLCSSVYESDLDGFEFRWLHADGSYRWFFARTRVDRGAEGRPRSVLGVAMDITERTERFAFATAPKPPRRAWNARGTPRPEAACPAPLPA